MRIFVSPLDWGLGHATRCVPIIKHLLEKNIEVIIGSEGAHLIFFKEHFSKIEYVEFPGYRVSYSATLPAGVKVLFQLPQLAAIIKKEHYLLDKIIADKKIDAVISDNRYGLWSKEIPSIIITHQLNIQAPAGKSFFNKTIHNHIKHFNECWIPDYEGEGNLSGTLSHPIPKEINGKYIGPLSRFTRKESSNKNATYDLLVLLSGPEPQRSKLEELILTQLKELPYIKALIIQGIPGKNIERSEIAQNCGIEIYPHLADPEFQAAINSSEVVLSRPGYSTLMDLNISGWKKAIFIPTPGQTEQEYLGNVMQEKGLGLNFKQNKFSIKDALEKTRQLSPVQSKSGNEKYQEVIEEWLRKII